jgi:predicted Zn-dependent peptidase
VLSTVRRTVLPGGLRVVTEEMAGVRSASVGVWVDVGSRDETPSLSGASHFLEHLLFKGTPERSALEISVAMDQVGGEFNAFTAREYTCFHARVLDVDLPVAVDVLGDMITSSTLSAADVEAEREVILDEIAMHDDDPEDVVLNLHAQASYGDSPLGRPIAGTADSVATLSRERIRRFYRTHYRAPRMVVAVAGNLDHDTVVEQVATSFARNGFLDGAGDTAPRAPRSGRFRRSRPGSVSATRPFEQANLVLGLDSISRPDERRYALSVLNACLGGGPSSRLFQEVRERRGLAYSIYSTISHAADAGQLLVGAGCLPGRLEDVVTVVRAELARLAADGITADELARCQGQLRGGLVLGLEDSAARMSRIGKGELLYAEPLPSIEELIQRVDAVTLEDVHSLAREIVGRQATLAVVSPR